MKSILLFALLAIANLVSAQADTAGVNKFITMFKSQLSNFQVGKIEEHYDEGYFKTLSESDYFDKDFEVGITSIYQKCAGKDETISKQEINSFFEQHKSLKIQRKEIDSKMTDFNFMKSYLKIRLYSDQLKPQYENHGIVKSSYNGCIEVIVLDLPSGTGSVERKYLDTWKKTEAEIFLLAKENTLVHLDQKFEKAGTAKTGEEFYLLSSDTDLFLTSLILDLKKANPPAGKFGTLISIPNNTVIVALPLNDKEKIQQFGLSFMGLTDFMYESKETKPISNNLFWLTGNEVFIIDKDLKNKMFIYPEKLKALIDK
ncbi:MAG TPA: hypothetical protein PLY34_17915 [Ferruginibacter sp.]|nr:hypothetical protein [Ferruginibacter sp.]HPH92162.1 hypothetical protein [Ferruginibacter sp.]